MGPFVGYDADVSFSLQWILMIKIVSSILVGDTKAM
jgi:hypothetical protein